MKKFKKIVASLMVAVMVLSAAPLSGFAGIELPNIFDIFARAAIAPTLSLNLVSESTSQVVVEVRLEGGEFATIDFGVEYNDAKITKCSNMTGCIDIAIAGATGEAASQAFNKETGLFSAVIASGYNKEGGVLATYTFDKVAGAEISNEDFELEVSCCTDVDNQFVKAKVVNKISVSEPVTEPTTERTIEWTTEPTTWYPTESTTENTTERTIEWTTEPTTWYPTESTTENTTERTTVRTTEDTTWYPHETTTEPTYVSPAANVKSIEVYKLPDKTTYMLDKDSYTEVYCGYENGRYVEREYERFDIDRNGLEMKVNFYDGTSEIVVDVWDYYLESYFYVEGQDYGEVWGVGKHTVTVSFYGHKATFKVEVIENPVESIEIYKLPDDTTLISGIDSYTDTYYNCYYDEYVNEYVTEEYEYECFNIDYSGMEIKVNFADGTYDITTDMWDYMDSYFEVTAQNYGEIWGIGKHTVTVSFYNRETTFEVEVVENPVKSIEVYKLPDDTTLISGIDSYTDTYYSCYYDEYVNEYVTEEYEYECFYVDYSGMEIKVNFTDGTYDIATDMWDYMGSYFEVTAQNYGEIWGIGKHTVTVSFYNRETTFEVEVVENPVIDIEFVYLPLKDEYLPGEIVDIEGARLKIYFKDGTNKIITIDNENSNWTCWTWESGKTDGVYWYLGIEDIMDDTTEYTFTYLGYSTNFTVNIADKSIVMVSSLSEPETPDGVGATVKVTYSDGTSEEMKVVDVDYRAGDFSSENYFAMGFIKTDKGIYLGAYACENVFETDKTTFRLTLGSSICDDSDSTAHTGFDKYFSIVRMVFIDLYVGRCGWVFDLESEWFDGCLTEKNIDLMIYAARNIAGYLYGVDYDTKEISGDIAKALLSKVFYLENIDLTLSQYYDAEKDTYVFTKDIGGWGDATVESYHVDVYGDCYYVTKTVTDPDGKLYYTTYAFFEADGRCSYFSSKPKDFTSLGNESKVNSVSINDISLSYKDSATIVPNVSADEGTKYEVTYSSSDTDVVSVDENGKVTTNGTGSATITVTVTDEYGNTVSDTCEVKVSYNWWQWIIVIVLFGWIWY